MDWWCCNADYPNHGEDCPNKEKEEKMAIQPIERLEQENAELKKELKQADALRKIRDGQLEELKKRAEELKDEIQLITAPEEATGRVYIAMRERAEKAEAENKDLRFKLSCHTKDCIADYEDVETRAERAEATRDYWHGEFERVGNQYEATLEKLEKAEADLAHAVIKIGAVEGLYLRQCEETQKVRASLATLKEAVENHRKASHPRVYGISGEDEKIYSILDSLNLNPKEEER